MTAPPPPPTVESKAWKGALTLDGTDFSCQSSAVRIRPTHSSSGDTLYLLCGNALTPDETRSDTLVIEAVQDFDNPDGFVAYTWTHDGEVVDFEWRPGEAAAAGVAYTGQVKVRAVEVGGANRVRLTTSAEWPCQGEVVVDYRVATP